MEHPRASASPRRAGGFSDSNGGPRQRSHMQARFYAPMYGRFLSPDPARDQHFEETQSWNIYSYVQNSPTMQIDPTGEVLQDPAMALNLAITASTAYAVHQAMAPKPTPEQTRAAQEQLVEKLKFMKKYFMAISGGVFVAQAAGMEPEEPEGEPIPVVEPAAAEPVPAEPIPTAEPEGAGGAVGRGANRLKPDPEATGPHSTFKRGADGNVSNHAEYKPNARNPSGSQQVKRVDVSGKEHTNPDGTVVPTPHVEEAGKKGVRPAQPDELPKPKRD